jgi:hypothetical protein
MFTNSLEPPDSRSSATNVKRDEGNDSSRKRRQLKQPAAATGRRKDPAGQLCELRDAQVHSPFCLVSPAEQWSIEPVIHLEIDES